MENIINVGENRLNRLYDRFFKKLFTSNKDVLVDFINDVLLLEGDDVVTDLELLPGEMIQPHDGMKLSMLDVSAKLSDGRSVDIEVQIVNRRDFRKRAPYYWSMRHVTKLQRGMSYVEAKPTILICLLAFDLLGEEQGYRNVYGICNEKSGNALCDDMRIIYLELPKFRRQCGEMPRTGLERWLMYFSNEEGEMMEKVAERDREISYALDLEKLFLANEAERERYLYEMRCMMDEISFERTHEILQKQAKEEGWREGIEMGKKEGIEQGIERGIEQGIERGIEQARRETAQNLLAAKVDVVNVARFTGLPEAEVRALIENVRGER